MTSTSKDEIQKSIIAKVPKNPHGILDVVQRTGKTKIAIDLMKRDKPKTVLWVTPSRKLIDNDIPEEFVKWRAKGLLSKTTFTTYKSLHKVTESYDWIILDEIQHLTENNSENLKYNNILGLTGSMPERYDKKLLLHGLGLNVIASYKIKEAIDDGVVSDYKIKAVDIRLSSYKDVVIKGRQKTFVTSELSNYEYLEKRVNDLMKIGGKSLQFAIFARRRFLINCKSKTDAAKALIAKLEGRILIFAGSIAQAELLCEHTFHSKSKNRDSLDMFLSGEIDKICLVNSGGTGFTYQDLDHLIVVQSDSDKTGLTNQKLTRILLKQGEKVVTKWMLRIVNTRDETWSDAALSKFNEKKIEKIKIDEL